MKEGNEDDDGFISINDFMNLDEEKGMGGGGEDEGNIDLEESN